METGPKIYDLIKRDRHQAEAAETSIVIDIDLDISR